MGVYLINVLYPRTLFAGPCTLFCDGEDGEGGAVGSGGEAWGEGAKSDGAWGL